MEHNAYAGLDEHNRPEVFFDEEVEPVEDDGMPSTLFVDVEDEEDEQDDGVSDDGLFDDEGPEIDTFTDDETCW